MLKKPLDFCFTIVEIYKVGYLHCAELFLDQVEEVLERRHERRLHYGSVEYTAQQLSYLKAKGVMYKYFFYSFPTSIFLTDNKTIFFNLFD